MITMKQWVVKKEIINFPNDWNRKRILKWINNRGIRICPVCKKIDVSYNHFNICNPVEQFAIQASHDRYWD